jgi:hypothetical protein
MLDLYAKGREGKGREGKGREPFVPCIGTARDV